MNRVSASKLKTIKLHLQNGGVIAYPTESCYGLGCDPYNYKAIKKVIRLKGRSSTKGLIVITGKFSHLNYLTTKLSLSTKQELSQYWPGQFSIILPTARNVPCLLTGKHKKVAVRITEHKQVKLITNHIGHAIVSTSANKSGKISIKNYRECIRQFGNKVLVIKGLTNFTKKPSTIIDWETKKIIR